MKKSIEISNLMPFVLDALNEGVFIVEKTAGSFALVQANLSLRKLAGLQEAHEGQDIRQLFDMETSRWLLHQLNKVARFNEVVESDITWTSCRDTKQHVRVRLMPIIGENGVDNIIGTVRLINDDIQLKESVRQRYEQYVTALEYAPYGVCFVGDDGKPTMVNRALCQWLDMPLNFIMQSPLNQFFNEVDQSVFSQALAKVINSGRSYRGIELKLRANNTQDFWVSLNMSRVDDVKNPYTIIQFVDITKRKQEEGELLRLATQDHLTGLSNRKVFDENLSMNIKQAKRYGRHGAVIYIDLDNFKGVNDTYGHKAGDAILQEVGKVLKDVFRETDTVARIGGDEFAVIMSEAEAQEAHQKAAIVEEKIKAIRIRAHEKDVSISASMGVQIFNAYSDLTEEDLVAAADKAMYAHKAQSKAEKTNLN